MPFVGTDLPTRKRRWLDNDDDGSDQLYRFYGPDRPGEVFYLDQPTTTQDRITPARKILPMTKRAKLSDGDLAFHDGIISPLKRLVTQRVGGALLTPCHICHRKPTRKSHLDAFAACQGCGERTCFVCIRECQGNPADDALVLSEQEVLSRSFHMDDVDDMANEIEEQKQQIRSREDRASRDGEHRGWTATGHRSVVCSRCCVERGAEGDVVCLGCLSRIEAT